MIYLKEPVTNRIIKFESLDAVGKSFEAYAAANQAEIDEYNLNETKQKYIANRKAYLAETFVHHEKDLDGHSIIDNGILNNRLNAHNQIDSIEATTTQAEFDALGLTESYP